MATSQKKDTFNDYEGFIEKFKPKKTTDDCYTPPYVYECVLKWIEKHVMPLDGVSIERPFYPGGDYQKAAENYGPDTVVIDNPPFSILAQIKSFYLSRGIRFFLFAPHLTIFSGDYQLTYILCNATIEYENDAKINTSFVTNLLPADVLAVTASDLRDSINDGMKAKHARRSAEKPSYRYDDHVLTSTCLDPLYRLGVDITIHRSEAHFIRALDSQRPSGKAIFGAGFLLSDMAAKRIEEARKRAEEARKRAEEARKIVWALSKREREIIDTLG